LKLQKPQIAGSVPACSIYFLTIESTSRFVRAGRHEFRAMLRERLLAASCWLQEEYWYINAAYFLLLTSGFYKLNNQKLAARSQHCL